MCKGALSRRVTRPLQKMFRNIHLQCCQKYQGTIKFSLRISSITTLKKRYFADIREVVTKEYKIFAQFVIDDNFLIKVQDTLWYNIKCNMRGLDTVKDDGSNEVPDSKPKKSPLKENKNNVMAKVCFSKTENNIFIAG